MWSGGGGGGPAQLLLSGLDQWPDGWRADPGEWQRHRIAGIGRDLVPVLHEAVERDELCRYVTQSPPALSCTASHGTGVINQAAPTTSRYLCTGAVHPRRKHLRFDLRGLVLANGNDSVMVANGATSFAFATPLLNGPATHHVSQTPLLFCVPSATELVDQPRVTTNISVTCASANGRG